MRRWARRIVIVGLIGGGAATVVSQWGEVSSALTQLKSLNWQDVRWAIYAELLALIAFAQLMRVLLRAGGANLRLRSILSLTLASIALALTLPGGPAWAATFSFKQLRRRGVARSLSICALLITWTMSAIALVVIALIGIDLAGDSGPAASLHAIAVPFTLASVPLAAASILLLRQRRPTLARAAARLTASERLGRLAAPIKQVRTELRAMHLDPTQWLSSATAAALNWILDCGCLTFSILAVGGHVPWQGLLAVYALTQLAAALPLTPGGIGITEGTLSLLLIACHMAPGTAIAAVTIYRLISFWLLVPIGWATAAALSGINSPWRSGRALGKRLTWTSPG